MEAFPLNLQNTIYTVYGKFGLNLDWTLREYPLSQNRRFFGKLLNGPWPPIFLEKKYVALTFARLARFATVIYCHNIRKHWQLNFLINESPPPPPPEIFQKFIPLGKRGFPKDLLQGMCGIIFHATRLQQRGLWKTRIICSVEIFEFLSLRQSE